MKNLKELALSILRSNISSYDDSRKSFFATEEEIICLRKAGANVVRWNYNNADGTFTHEVEFNGYKFLSSTTKQI